MNVIDIGIAAVVILFILVRRVAGGPVQLKRLIVLPLVLIAIGATDITAPHHRHNPLTGSDTRFLILAGAVSLAFGLLRGLSIHVWNRDGVVWQRYRAMTVVLWLITIGVRVAMDMSAHTLGASSAVAGSSLLLMFGISLVGESIIVAGRLAARGEIAALGSPAPPRVGGNVGDRYTRSR